MEIRSKNLRYIIFIEYFWNNQCRFEYRGLVVHYGKKF